MKTCRNCGASNSADDRFCGNCGAALPEQDDQQPVGQREQVAPASSEVKGDQQSGPPAWGAPQPTSTPHGQQQPSSDPYGNPPGNQYGQQAQGPYGQPGANPYGQPSEGQYGQQGQPYGQPPYDPQGQPYGQQPGQYGQPYGQYGQQPGNPYGDQTPQPWYATGTGDTPPPARRRGRSGLRTALLIIVGLILLVCIGSIVFAVTPYGSDQVERLGTWAAEESTRQAGE